MTGIAIDEVVARLGLPPGAYVATTREDAPRTVVLSDLTQGRIVATTHVDDAAAWCRAFNARRLGSGWWAGRVVTNANEGEEGTT